MTDATSRQLANAQVQKEEVFKRVLKTRQEIRAQIKLSHDKTSGQYKFLISKNGRLVEKKRFCRSDFLRLSGIDKNTLKRDYHAASRTMVSRLIVWVNAKISKGDPRPDDLPNTASSNEVSRPYHAIIASERDAIAEKYALLEIQLSDALRAARLAEQEKEEALADLKKTRDSVASLTNLLLKIGSEHGSNVLALPDRID